MEAGSPLRRQEGVPADAQRMASSSPPSPSQEFLPSEKHRPVVLVTHGSMNPVHSGHIQMMARAKAVLETRLFSVVAGVIGITRASHIAGKGVLPMTDEERLRLLEHACASEPWLGTCGGEGVTVMSARALAANMLPSFRKRHGGSVLTVTVEGSDVFTRWPPRPGRLDPRVVVMREGDDGKAQAQLSRIEAAQRAAVLLLAAGPNLGAVSSTLVRAALARRDRAELVRMCGEPVADALLAVEPCPSSD